MLQLDEKAVLWSTLSAKPREWKTVYKVLMNKLLDENIDYNMEHYYKFNKIPGLEGHVIFEKEVADTFLKELVVERKLKRIQEDFE